MVPHHALNFDWRHESFDDVAVHASSGGKAHGRLDLTYRYYMVMP